MDNLGIAAYMLDDRDAAYEYFQKAYLAAPTSVQVLANLGTVIHERGQPEQGLVYLDRAIARVPGYCPPRIESILVMQSLDNPVEAKRRLRALPEHCRADQKLAVIREWLDQTGDLP